MRVARCATVTASSWCTGLGVLRHSFLPNEPKINCNENTNNDKCSLPVIHCCRVFDRHRRDHRKSPATTAARNGTRASLLSLQFQAQNDTRRAAAGPGPCAPVRGWGLTYMTVCGTMSWFPAANSLLEFLCLIIQKARSLKSWKNLISNPHYHYQKNCSRFKEEKLSQSCRPSKKLTVIIHNTQRRNTRRLLRGFALLEMT